MPIAGLGPHGERAALPERLELSDEVIDCVRKKRATVATVLHTSTSDWAKQLLAGITSTLGRYGAAVVDVIDCNFSSDTQVKALGRLMREAPDAIISLPVGNIAVAHAHRSVARSPIKLILLDNAPSGLLPGTDYVSVVSADNFGLGQIGAELLSPHIPAGGTAGILAYATDFFATNERCIAFRKSMEANRPDVSLKQVKFWEIARAGAAVVEFLGANPDVGGLFAVWDGPAMEAVAAMRSAGIAVPLTTIDLGNDAAIELASGDIIKGIGAQQPYDQGVAVAKATLLALAGQQPPPWVALPGVSVTARNVIETYQLIWHTNAPSKLIAATSKRMPR